MHKQKLAPGGFDISLDIVIERLEQTYDPTGYFSLFPLAQMPRSGTK